MGETLCWIGVSFGFFVPKEDQTYDARHEPKRQRYVRRLHQRETCYCENNHGCACSVKNRKCWCVVCGVICGARQEHHQQHDAPYVEPLVERDNGGHQKREIGYYENVMKHLSFNKK